MGTIKFVDIDDLVVVVESSAIASISQSSTDGRITWWMMLKGGAGGFHLNFYIGQACADWFAGTITAAELEIALGV